MKAPSTMARTASGAEMLLSDEVLSAVAFSGSASLGAALSGRTRAKLRTLFPLRVRTAVPASLRNSVAEKVLALPPPKRSRRFAFKPVGRWRSVVSNIFAVTSPLAITSLAALRTAVSAPSIEGEGLSFSAWSFSLRSRTTTTRQSVSSFDGAVEERFVFMMDYFSIHGGRGNAQLSRHSLGLRAKLTSPVYGW